jgi:hypothetical protein
MSVDDASALPTSSPNSSPAAIGDYSIKQQTAASRSVRVAGVAGNWCADCAAIDRLAYACIDRVSDLKPRLTNA